MKEAQTFLGCPGDPALILVAEDQYVNKVLPALDRLPALRERHR